jgi:protein-disulfide isomerase/uncharacterized membrane protein
MALSRRLATPVLVTLALVGATASAILYADHAGAPVFCDDSGGCGVIRRTAWSAIAGVPTPVLGLVGFTTLLFLLGIGGRWSRRALLGASASGALLALMFVGLQVHLGAFCRYCLVADGAMIAFNVTAWLTRGTEPTVGLDARRRALVAVALATAVGVPLLVGASRRPSVATAPTLPPVIAAELAGTPPGRVTIVEFVDFECPFCRLNDVALQQALAGRRDRVRLVRKQVPLERIHPHALAAARAACCGELLGRADPLASLLFAAPLDQLTEAGCEELATRAGISLADYRACLASPELAARLRSDADAFTAAHGQGLPTLWIGGARTGGTELIGAQSTADLARVLDAALTGS